MRNYWLFSMPGRKNDYTTIKLPTALLDRLDSFLDDNKEYTSRTDVVKEALRNYLREE